MADKEIILIEVARRGRDGDYAGTSEVAALQSRASALEARPNITSLNAVPNVSAASPGTNQVLRWDGSAWVPATVTTGVPQIVRSGDPSTAQNNVTQIVLSQGLTTSSAGEGSAYILPVYAGAGTASTIARSDHVHTMVSTPGASFGPMGYMSSGTRVLASTNVTLANGIDYRVKATLKGQIRGADAGSCYYQLRVTINGNARTSNGGTSGFWCVQGVPREMSWSHSIALSGTGAAITIMAEVIYHSGGGFNTDAGEVEITLYPRR